MFNISLMTDGASCCNLFKLEAKSSDILDVDNPFTDVPVWIENAFCESVAFVRRDHIPAVTYDVRCGFRHCYNMHKLKEIPVADN